MTLKKISMLAVLFVCCETWLMAQCTYFPAIRAQQVAIYQSPHYQNEFRGIRIDSVYSPNGVDSEMFMYPIVNAQTGCIDTISWLGTKIFKQGTNKTYFIEGTDTVTVENDACKTQGWQVTSYPNGNKLKAKELDSVYNPVFNETVKEIGMQLKDQFGNDLPAVINNNEMWLARSHGLVKFYDVATLLTDSTVFNLIGLTKSGYGFQNYGAKEAFSFDPGNILEWRESYHNNTVDSSATTTMQWTILNKSVNADTSVLTYSIARQWLIHITTATLDSTTTILQDTISQTYTLSDYSFVQDLPDEYFLNAGTYGSGFVTFDTANYNTQYIVKNARYAMSLNGTCFEPLIGASYDASATFANGLGIVKSINDNNVGNDIFDTTKLTFFRKGGVQWGTSVFANGISTVKNNLHVQVYPNPFNDQFVMQFPKMITKGTITLADASGKIVLQQSIRNTDFATIDKLNLAKGVYVLSIITEQGNWNQKIVKN